VRWIPANNPAWFSATDNLEGTYVKGVEGDDTYEWSINFKDSAFSEFLFATGDF
jgi:hypothetical protein